MPVKTWDFQSDFDGAYRIRLDRHREDDPSLTGQLPAHYDRRALFSTTVPALNSIGREWTNMVAHFNWPLTHSILVVGCGFGWSVEHLQSAGYTSSWGTDPSIYIQVDKDTVDPADGVKRSLDPTRIHDADVSKPNNRGQLILATVGAGNRFDVIVSERVLSSLTDAEVVSFRNDLDEMRADPDGVIIHIEDSEVPGPGNDPAMNWKPLANWKTLLPLDIMVRSGGSEFL